MFGGLSLGIPAAAVAAGSSMDHREGPHQSPMIPAGGQRLGQQAGLPAGQRAHQQPAQAVQTGGAGLDDIFGGLALGGERWPGTVAPRLGFNLSADLAVCCKGLLGSESVSTPAACIALLQYFCTSLVSQKSPCSQKFCLQEHEHAFLKLGCMSMGLLIVHLPTCSLWTALLHKLVDWFQLCSDNFSTTCRLTCAAAAAPGTASGTACARRRRQNPRR